MDGNIVTKRKTHESQITYANAIQFNKHDGIGTRNVLIALNVFVKNEANLNFLLLRFTFSASLDSLALQEVLFELCPCLSHKPMLNTDGSVADLHTFK
ncbi:hypothetical protein T11_6579 [Trichinella zimbabwensis]|uniref:Uncharacterized protein n=1 Tax=Trichinella zimbabwensis TaxID=268475 RepID=A0A0V1I7S5_9BILA|nr:hypothetical protein T11_6579 [Trichinella zimbabwensis]